MTIVIGKFTRKVHKKCHKGGGGGSKKCGKSVMYYLNGPLQQIQCFQFQCKPLFIRILRRILFKYEITKKIYSQTSVA